MPFFLIGSYTWWQKPLATHQNPFPFFFTEMELSLSTWDCDWAILALPASSIVRQAHMTNHSSMDYKWKFRCATFWAWVLRKSHAYSTPIFSSHYSDGWNPVNPDGEHQHAKATVFQLSGMDFVPWRTFGSCSILE